jgi:hypothetical protein
LATVALKAVSHEPNVGTLWIDAHTGDVLVHVRAGDRVRYHSDDP